MNNDIKIIACSASREFATKVCFDLGVNLVKSKTRHFADGEISVNISEAVREKDVYVLQSTCPPVNENMIELLITIDALKRSSAGRITAVIPYYGYARQDRKTRSREPITAKLVADLITHAGADRILTMDLHCNQIEGFFNIPVDHLRGNRIFIKHCLEKYADRDDTVIVAPDFGSTLNVRRLANSLNAPIAIIDKRRPDKNKSEIINIIGEFKNKTCLICDDLIDTAGTITNAANYLKEKGAKEVFAFATHPVLSGPAIEKINDSAIEKLYILDTITLPSEKKLSKIEVLTATHMFADGIKSIHEGTSFAKLFDNA